MTSSLLDQQLCEELGLDKAKLKAGQRVVKSPITGEEIAKLADDTAADVTKKIALSHQAYLKWRNVPAPKRGELIRIFGDVLREYKTGLGKLVTIEAGKITSEGLGEVQEMIDICDFAVGLSRQLYGLTIASERPNHRMMETWHPLGVIGVISAFNFPVAVWAWNFCLAIVCGNAVVWKPSEKTPLTALACQHLWQEALKRFGKAPEGLSEIIIGDKTIGDVLVNDKRVPLISATGSTRMGKEVAPKVALRLGRSLLELGGNNAMIVCPSADLELAKRAILFAAVGTAGQRCTTLRRLIVHEEAADQLTASLQKSYASLPIGSPLESKTLIGPLIDGEAFKNMQHALTQAQSQGGKILAGGKRVLESQFPNAYYVEPALLSMPSQTAQVKEEVFAPILYVMRYKNFDEALAMHNDVTQGLSSCIFTQNIREAEQFLSAQGSDCGIANVNIGPSGAEIGGAFGGEKETGGGRESGSDSWKNYMRRATNTINYGVDLPLAQGVKFEA